MMTKMAALIADYAAGGFLAATGVAVMIVGILGTSAISGY